MRNCSIVAPIINRILKNKNEFLPINTYMSDEKQTNPDHQFFIVTDGYRMYKLFYVPATSKILKRYIALADPDKDNRYTDSLDSWANEVVEKIEEGKLITKDIDIDELKEQTKHKTAGSLIYTIRDGDKTYTYNANYLLDLIKLFPDGEKGLLEISCCTLPVFVCYDKHDGRGFLLPLLSR